MPLPILWGRKIGLERFQELRCPFSQCIQTRLPSSKVLHITNDYFPHLSLSPHAYHMGIKVPKGFGVIA